MSSGGGTTTQVSKTELPSWLQDAAQSNLARADYVSQLGYVPQYGLDVAGFTPMQTAAMQNTADAASAFGLSAPTNAMAGMPAQQTNNLGFSGYSSGALYDDALAQLQANRPAQYDAINDMFIDPNTGQAGTAFTPFGSVAGADASQAAKSLTDYSLSGNYEDLGHSGGFDAANPYDSADAYNNAQKFNAWMKSQKDNPLVQTSLIMQGLNLLNNSYLDSAEAMNASQGGSMLTTGTGSTGTVGQDNSNNWSNWSSGYETGSGWGNNLSSVQSDIDSSGYGLGSGSGWGW